ncbi:MAG: alpha/beta hydrolase [Saprospiraceae bacterium]|nr:alpha/beta hydrolase [Saprospiraceae bacterium]
MEKTKKTLLLFASIVFYSISLPAQNNVSIFSNGIKLSGTIEHPKHKTEKAILILSGSGKTDRDGNTKPLYINNALKKLALELADLGYASLRYDKRGVGESLSDSFSYETLRFEDYVLDASNWITYLKKEYSHITVLGHSQGALVGMLAIQNNPVQKFISLAGISEDLYTTLKRQLSNQPGFVQEAAFPILDRLKIGVKVDSVPPYLQSLMGPSVQNYFMTCLKYDPREEIKKLDIPILIIQGSNDIQITVEGATEMSKQSEFTSLSIIDGMNHVLRKCSTLATENMATYNNPELPLHHELIEKIVLFLNNNK